MMTEARMEVLQVSEATKRNHESPLVMMVRRTPLRPPLELLVHTLQDTQISMIMPTKSQLMSGLKSAGINSMFQMAMILDGS
jgi:hypothetical protein